MSEVLSYRAALNQAVARMETLPLSQRLLKEAHRALMQGARGQSRAPGEYRRIQNWVGPPGCTLETARFVPASAEFVPEAMSVWERYLHAEAPDTLIQLAVLHAELEAIHPFLDGNGRLGRLLVPLYLVDKKLLSSPNFYVSAYLEAHRDEYYERLLAVSRDGDWTGWCVFFLTAVLEQARSNHAKAKAILDLYQAKKHWLAELTHSHHAVKALDWFFSRPVFGTSDFIASSGIPKPTANRIVHPDGYLVSHSCDLQSPSRVWAKAARGWPEPGGVESAMSVMSGRPRRSPSVVPGGGMHRSGQKG